MIFSGNEARVAGFTQLNPDSITKFEVQLSPDKILPSSQPPGFLTLFPQIGGVGIRVLPLITQL